MGKFEAAELIRLLRKMLLRFNADATDVSATERYYVIQDGVLRFGFERYSFHFPGISDMYQHRSDNHCLVPRNQLGSSLALLAAVNKNPHLLVHLMTRERPACLAAIFSGSLGAAIRATRPRLFPIGSFRFRLRSCGSLRPILTRPISSSRFIATELCMFLMRTGNAGPIVYSVSSHELRPKVGDGMKG